jgi:serine/threonine protein kinase
VQFPGTIGPYRISETIAAGGMGVVYRAYHVDTGQVVALKTVAGLRPGMVGSMRREILALVRLRHPGVVRLVGEGLHEGLPWHAMELLDGHPLRSHIDDAWRRLRGMFEHATTYDGVAGWMTTAQQSVQTLEKRQNGRGGPPVLTTVPVEQRPPAGGDGLALSLTILRRLCQTLAFLHGEGIVHGDVKPENVVLQAAGKPVLVDFGIMRRVAGAAGREALELEHDGAGTLAYMAPEQIRASDIDARADLYALGCILYEMVCGRPPFLDDWNGSIYEQQLERPPCPPSELVRGMPPRLEQLILRLLAKRPDERPGYADDVGAELEALGGEPWPEFSQPPPRSYLYRPGFSGRVGMIGDLERELEAARDGHGRCVLLTGPSGSGKTRLCLELARVAQRRGMRVLSGECLPLSAGDTGTGQPLMAFRPLLQAVADRCRVEPGLSERLLSEEGPVLEEVEPALARLPGLRHAERPRLSEERAGERVQNAVVQVLRRFAAQQPLLIILDDLQWADDLSLAVVRALVNQPESELHAVLMATCRSESGDAALNALRSAPGALKLRLDPLGASEVERIIAGMTALREPPPSLARHVAHESGGNPFFVAEYLKAAVAEGLLRRESGEWQFRVAHQNAPSLLAPGSVQALVARRLDGLGEEARTVVEAGAVLGRSFAPEELQAVAGQPVEAAVDELLARQILSVEETTDQLRFVHDKIRETTYERIGEAERRRWHARAAEVLLRSAEDPAVWRRLAHHYRQAQDDAHAFEWAERAGRQALSGGAFREAREHLEVACALQPADRPPLERARLHRMYAEALDYVGEIVAGGRQQQAVLEALERPLPKTRLGWVTMAVGQIVRQGWHRLAPEDLLAKEERRPALREAAISASRLVSYYYLNNQVVELFAAVTMAVNLAELAGDDAPHARAGTFLAYMVGLLGMRGVAEGYFERTREAARRSGDLGVELFQAQVEGMYRVHRADWETVQARVNPAIERGTAAGAAFGTESLLLPATLASLLTGDLDTAEAQATRMWQSARTNGHGVHQIWSTTLLAEIALRRGRAEETVAQVEPMLTNAPDGGDVVNRLNCVGLLAGAKLRLGDLPGALATARTAEQQIADNPAAALAPFHLHEHVPAVYLAGWEAGDMSLAAEATQACRRARRYARIADIAKPLALRHEARRLRILGRARRAQALIEESLRLARACSMPFDVEEARRMGGTDEFQ